MRELRFVAGVLLLIGMILVGYWFPSRPKTGWADASGFRLDPETCRAQWGEREQTTFIWSEEQPVAFEEVARRFDLELDLVCEANSQPGECGDSPLDPGDQIVLPLAPNSPGVTSPTSAPASPAPAEESAP